jgi:hypothetical protein
MCRLTGNPGLARAMGQAGECYAAAHYGWDQIAARMEGLYENLSC